MGKAERPRRMAGEVLLIAEPATGEEVGKKNKKIFNKIKKFESSNELYLSPISHKVSYDTYWLDSIEPGRTTCLVSPESSWFND